MNQPIKTDRKTQLETLLVISTGLIFLFGIFWYRGSSYKGLLIAAFCISVIGLISPWIAEKINFAWYKLAELLGRIMSPILMSIVFFLFLFPIALLSRVFSKNDSLQLKKKADGDSYYVDREHQYVAKDFENIW